MVFGTSIFAQTPPKRELRGAWIATYANIDWPSNGATSAQEQSTYIQRVEEHRITGMNAVYVQIRSQCDAMYPSAFEPWSRDLTGTQGTPPNPYYDPLEFMITETRKKGMEFHAWFNPYRALASATTTNLNALHSTHLINTQSSWILDCTTGSTVQKILNPGLPQVWEHVIKVVMDVVRRYDVDGIHFDDYFYPNPALTTYNDDATFAANSRGIATKAEWRRSNVDTLIRRLGDSIRSVKPWVKFGISPSGIWLSQNNDPVNGSNTSSGATQHYKDLFCNSRLWMQQGWIDYLMPQVYWFIGQSGSDYNILVPWWNNNSFSRHMYIGLAGYKVGDMAQNAAFATNTSQIPSQVRLNRLQTNIRGQVVYNTTSLRNNPLGFRDSLQQNFYNKSAMLPTMAWKDNIAPQPATALTITLQGDNSRRLNWTNPTPSTDSLQRVKRIAIYRSTNSVVDISNSNNLIAITWNDAVEYTDAESLPVNNYYYVVTTLDRLYNESTASNVASFGPLPLQMVQFVAWKNGANTAQLQWTTANEVNIEKFEIQRSVDGVNFIAVQNVAAGLQRYMVTDKFSTNSGTLYYRLKVMEKDGSHTYSAIRTINLNDTKTAIKVFPTIVAAGQQMQLIIPKANGQKSIRWLSTDGKQVAVTVVQFANGMAKMLVPATVMSGSYWLQYIDNETVRPTLIVVQ
jgi:uncharacterized lipoprotein YddW (UPF0748 family)